jgi:hypothetical protein
MSHLSGKMEEDKRKRHPGVIAGSGADIASSSRGKKGAEKGQKFQIIYNKKEIRIA